MKRNQDLFSELFVDILQWSSVSHDDRRQDFEQLCQSIMLLFLIGNQQN